MKKLRSWTLIAPAALAVIATAACSDEPETSDPVRTIGGDRPATLTLPSDYEAGTAIPLMIVLHGFTSNAAQTDSLFGFSRRIESDRIAVIMPNGTRNPRDQRFWRATDYCCNFHGSTVDDVAYLNSLVEEASRHMAVDGVYLFGLSNGGFMSYRMACESMPGLRAIASVAGTSFTDPARCEGARPISVLHIHGTADRTIRYAGGDREGVSLYPGAEETVHRWAGRAGCAMEAAETLPSMDLVEALPAEETNVTRYATGCDRGLKVELWTIEEGRHVPRVDADDFGARVVAWFAGAGG